ncbi:hypothetical protein [Flavobacterium sp. N1994]|uniref:hypothetical protein n=1 Tax=Flavobacterium sp. N1994 TaxID=2986827 RepID=UPI002223425A|nr:hypothetical protein [Flavobacterium sp. N1994]
MPKPLLSLFVKKIEFHYFIVGLVLLFVQKTSATTFYVNDDSLKGDTYTTAIGNNNNDGISPTSPKLSIQSAYQKAQDGDNIVIETYSYSDLYTKGVLTFEITIKDKFIITGITDSNFSQAPLLSNQKVSPTEFYIENDKPIDRDAYLRNLKTE